MFNRFFSQTSRMSKNMKTPIIAQTGRSIEETTQEQINRLRQDPKYAGIFKEMDRVAKQTKDSELTKPVSIAEIGKLLDMEKENAKFSIY